MTTIANQYLQQIANQHLQQALDAIKDVSSLVKEREPDAAAFALAYANTSAVIAQASALISLDETMKEILSIYQAEVSFFRSVRDNQVDYEPDRA